VWEGFLARQSLPIWPIQDAVEVATSRVLDREGMRHGSGSAHRYFRVPRIDAVVCLC
jgi:hypothetical protein